MSHLRPHPRAMSTDTWYTLDDCKIAVVHAEVLSSNQIDCDFLRIDNKSSLSISDRRYGIQLFHRYCYRLRPPSFFQCRTWSSGQFVCCK